MKHVPTGLYYTPTKKIYQFGEKGDYTNPAKTNLSKKGKVYTKIPSIKWIGRHFWNHTILTLQNYEKRSEICYQKVLPEEWIIEEVKEEHENATIFDFGAGPIPSHQHINPDGSLGGWVADTATVSATVFVEGKARVYGNARVSGKAWVSGDAQVYGNAQVFENALVSGKAWVSGKARVSEEARVYGNAWVCGNACVSEKAWVCGDARVYGKARVSGDTEICN
jgi:carbonic anhydrase/acetyltransferase-like protein (isoleucine patch superfamily)